MQTLPPSAPKAPQARPRSARPPPAHPQQPTVCSLVRSGCRCAGDPAHRDGRHVSTIVLMELTRGFTASKKFLQGTPVAVLRSVGPQLNLRNNNGANAVAPKSSPVLKLRTQPDRQASCGPEWRASAQGGECKERGSFSAGEDLALMHRRNFSSGPNEYSSLLAKNVQDKTCN